MPVDEAQTIRLSVETEREVRTSIPLRRIASLKTALQNATLPIALTLRDGESGIKLVRGFYVIVPLFDGDSDPRWSNYELKKLDGRWALHDSAGTPASFEHIVLRIDYAAS
jgi:hypothetical protein